jgi:hypothetical protein
MAGLDRSYYFLVCPLGFNLAEKRHKVGDNSLFLKIQPDRNSMTEQKLSPEILKTKQHFEILDGLRGVAALSVVAFHFMEMAIYGL